MRQSFVLRFTTLLSSLILILSLSACGGGSQALSSTDSSNSAPNQTTGGNSNLPSGNLSVALSWTSPLTYTDSTPLNDLAGTNIYVKVGTGNYELLTSVKSSATVSYVVHNLGAGYSYTFAVTAFNSLGVESSFSSPFTVQL